MNPTIHSTRELNAVHTPPLRILRPERPSDVRSPCRAGLGGTRTRCWHDVVANGASLEKGRSNYGRLIVVLRKLARIGWKFSSGFPVEDLPANQQFEFGIDRRTRRPVISKPESLKRLIACFRLGIVVAPIEHWGNPILVNKDVQAVLHMHARPIEVPENSHLYAWGWDWEVPEATSGYCLNLRRLSGAGACADALPKRCISRPMAYTR